MKKTKKKNERMVFTLKDKTRKSAVKFDVPGFSISVSCTMPDKYEKNETYRSALRYALDENGRVLIDTKGERVTVPDFDRLAIAYDSLIVKHAVRFSYNGDVEINNAEETKDKLSEFLKKFGDVTFEDACYLDGETPVEQIKLTIRSWLFREITDPERYIDPESVKN